jgi:hypothetical protein
MTTKNIPSNPSRRITSIRPPAGTPFSNFENSRILVKG